MRHTTTVLLACLCLGLATTVSARENPPPPRVEAWDVQKTGAIGSAIFLQDRAAARATDALLARFNGAAPEGLIGWVVIENGPDHLVRFLTGHPTAPRPAYDIVVAANGRAGDVTDATETTLPADQLARFSARMTAGTSFSASDLRCAARYNVVVLDDPDSEGWLVWLLASTTDANKVPMGGHYRFHISADGQTIIKREQLSASCLELDRRQSGRNGQPAGLVTNLVVAPQPLEIHVFLSLQNNLPIFTAAGDKIWVVQGALIRDMTDAVQ